MNRIVIKAHRYVSASRKLDMALERHHDPVNANEAFQNMIITLVDEACENRILYSPADADGRPLGFEMHNTPVAALYTDKEAALKCAEMCTGKANACMNELDKVLDVSDIALGVNMGLPTSVILPPDVVNTVRHLKYVHQLNWKHAPDSKWNDWINIMDRYFEDKREVAAEEAQYAEDAAMYIPLQKDDARDVYVLG